MAAPKTTQFSAAFPSAPLLDDTTRLLTPAWRGFFRALWARTGDVHGVDLSGVTQSLVEADNALSARDDELAAEIAAETTARRSADSAELTARTNADAALRAAMLPLSGGTLTGPLSGPVGAFGTLQAGAAVWRSGPGAPTWTAVRGSLWSRTDGVVGSTLYVSQGSGSWLAVAGV